MCGRARLSSDVSEIKLVFSIPPHRPTPNIAPSWNVAPTDPLSVVRYDPRAGERSLDVMLVPIAGEDPPAIAREFVGEVLGIADAEDLRTRLVAETPGREGDRGEVRLQV